MGFYDKKKNVEEYIKLAEGFEGVELIKILRKHLPEGSSLLELGMGPGKDLDILKKNFKVTGSDSSDIFLDMYKQKNPEAELLKLDAVTLDTEKQFDCIYSNKVLMHLPQGDMFKSLLRQVDVLKSNGLLFHSFWYGKTSERFDGLLFNYYNEGFLHRAVGTEYELVEMKKYTEMEKDDSIYMILRKRSEETSK